MGQSMKYIWATQGLYPCLYLFELTWYSALLFWISIIYWLINLLFAATAVSRVTYKQLKGDEFYSTKESREYVKRHWHAIIFSPVSIFLMPVKASNNSVWPFPVTPANPSISPLFNLFFNRLC